MNQTPVKAIYANLFMDYFISSKGIQHAAEAASASATIGAK